MWTAITGKQDHHVRPVRGLLEAARSRLGRVLSVQATRERTSTTASNAVVSETASDNRPSVFNVLCVRAIPCYRRERVHRSRKDRARSFGEDMHS